MTRYIDLIIVLLIVICSGCVAKSITGEITVVNERTVTCKGIRFLIYPNIKTPLLGDTATFSMTKIKSKVNCIKLKK